MNDRIVKQTTLRAPQERVWQAITDAGKFGEWFGVQFDGPFEAGRRASDAGSRRGGRSAGSHRRADADHAQSRTRRHE